ncbi:MAG: hypothetical protein ACI4XM_01820 [Candidatus Coprovivens sp.]
MTKLIVLLTFIPWLLYFASLCKSAIKDLNDNKLCFTWIKNNFFKIFHFENLILIGIFVYFSINYYKANQIWLVEVLLFGSINLYLFFNRYYDKNNIEYKIGNKDITTILIILFIVLLTISYYLTTNNHTLTYYIFFGYSFFNYIIVFLSKIINDLIYKIVRRHNNEIK